MDNKQLEKLIVKACLLDKSFLVTIATVFNKSYFDSPVVSEIFAFMKDHVEKYGNIAPREAIISSLPQYEEDVKELLFEIDAIEFDVPKNYDYLFDQTNDYLKEKAIKNAILESVEVINKKEEERAKIRNIIETALCKDLRIDIGLNYFDTLSERLKRILNTSVVRIPTCFPQLDEYLNGGFPPFTFSVFVSRVHGFKSNTLANFSSRQVLKGHNPVICSLEMSEDAFAQRFDSMFTNLDINKIYTVKSVSSQLIAELKKVKETTGRGTLFIKQFPTGDASVVDITRYLRELIMRGIKPSVLYVDYINIMKPSYTNRGDMYSDVKRIAEELRALSFKFEIPVISVSQLNREGSMVSFEELDFVYISESMGVPATADFMAIYGQDDERLIYESELHYKIVKNRLGGRVGEIDKFYYDARTLKMYDGTELDLWLADARITGDERKTVELQTTQSGETRRRRS